MCYLRSVLGSLSLLPDETDSPITYSKSFGIIFNLNTHYCVDCFACLYMSPNPRLNAIACQSLINPESSLLPLRQPITGAPQEHRNTLFSMLECSFLKKMIIVPTYSRIACGSCQLVCLRLQARGIAEFLLCSGS